MNKSRVVLIFSGLLLLVVLMPYQNCSVQMSEFLSRGANGTAYDGRWDDPDDPPLPPIDPPPDGGGDDGQEPLFDYSCTDESGGSSGFSFGLFIDNDGQIAALVILHAADGSALTVLGNNFENLKLKGPVALNDQVTLGFAEFSKDPLRLAIAMNWRGQIVEIPATCRRAE